MISAVSAVVVTGVATNWVKTSRAYLPSGNCLSSWARWGTQAVHMSAASWGEKGWRMRESATRLPWVSKMR